MGEILVGTSSWADQSLVRSGWYPRAANTPAGRLDWYARHFRLVEVDTSYYAVPTVQTTTGWVAATPAEFTFDVKAFSLFTGHPTPVTALPRDLRPAGHPGWIRARDLPDGAYEQLWDRFRTALDPLAAAGRLGTVLLQYPPWFTCSEAARRRIVATAQRLRPARVAVEVRHPSWLTGEHREQTLALLRSHGLTLVGVDMPQGLPGSVPPELHHTAEPAVLRLHGRSPAWASGDKQERYRYAYPEAELRDWADRLTALAAGNGQVHVLFNNCCAGQAQRDAARLAALLPARVPC
jgi:uncharacterized protein YecE (DUF72 family)